jgi:hypothetical protein
LSEGSLDPYQQALLEMYGCKSEHIESTRLAETFQGQRIWEGTVHVFFLIGHPTARRVYIWSHPVKGVGQRRFQAALHQGKVNSPQAAVRESLARKYRERGGR